MLGSGTEEVLMKRFRRVGGRSDSSWSSLYRTNVLRRGGSL